MKKGFLLIIILIISSCSNNSKNINLKEADLLDDSRVSEIDINFSDIIIGTGTKDEDIIENTTDEEIDELIDILFETNFN